MRKFIREQTYTNIYVALIRKSLLNGTYVTEEIASSLQVSHSVVGGNSYIRIRRFTNVLCHNLSCIVLLRIIIYTDEQIISLSFKAIKQYIFSFHFRHYIICVDCSIYLKPLSYRLKKL